MNKHHPSKMTPLKGAPPGLEKDGKGKVIPFEERTEDDRKKVVAAAPPKRQGKRSKAAKA